VRELIPTGVFANREYEVIVEGDVNGETIEESLEKALAHAHNAIAAQIDRDREKGDVNSDPFEGTDIPEHKQIAKPPSAETAAPSGGQPAQSSPSPGGDMASEKQQKLVYAKLKGLDYDNNRIKQFLIKFAGVDNTKKLKWKQINSLVKKIDEITAARPPDPEPELDDNDPFN